MITLFLALIVGLLGAVVYADAKQEKIVINKREWKCSNYRTDISYIPTYPDGKSLVMMPIFSDVCTQYIRR